MVMTVNVPAVTKTKDGMEYVEYQSDDVQDNVFRSVLRQSYRMFRLFKGSFCHILSSHAGDVQPLRHKLEHFFSRYLMTLKLNHCDILDVFQGIQFLPLDKQTFLRVQCFVNLVEAMFSQVQHTAFLYNDQLVWSGLEPDDMQVVYRYLVTSLLPTHMETELQGGSMPRHPTSPFTTTHYGSWREEGSLVLCGCGLMMEREKERCGLGVGWAQLEDGRKKEVWAWVGGVANERDDRLQWMIGLGTRIKGRGKLEISERTRQPMVSSSMIPTCENPVTRPGIEPGPSNLQDSSGSMGKIPRVYVNNSTGPEMYHLIVYRALSATLCMFVDGMSPLSLEMFKRMDVFLGPQLTALVSDVAEQCNKQASASTSPTDPGPRFVYFNQLNLAQKSTVHLDGRRCGNVGVSLEVLRLLADINADKSRNLYK
ncbi:hypothetical protein PR048_017592 [Dryococelus australis]|uniref:CCZ1/INTU second Longin domain-containing protein n=1 Tax=Dryococelus australis TaxID=614101 RepID=A0ABQ9HA14_9NEOP|nr:hypothetical protein PR048_017592 [Dryococelus australis]